MHKIQITQAHIVNVFPFPVYTHVCYSAEVCYQHVLAGFQKGMGTCDDVETEIISIDKT